MSFSEDLQRQLINDMLIESHEGLDRFDRYLLELEKGSADGETLNAIFRVIHTIKGTSGCLALGRIERVAHVGENLLQLMREGRLKPNRERITTLLSLSDALREMLRNLEHEGTEGTAEYADLLARLDVLTSSDEPGAGAKWGLFDDEPAPATAVDVPVPAAPCASPAPPAPAVERTVTEDAPTARAAAPAEAPEAPSAPRGPSVSDSAIRVDVGQLDKLMNLVGELVLARNQILQHSERMTEEGLSAASQRLNIITTELQESVMKTRMQPIRNVWSKFPRIVRDLATELGKQVTLVMEGEETELDRTIIEAIKDPLTHILRNSVDHGLERPDQRSLLGKPAAGRVLLRAYHEGGQVNIEVSDDGHGINVERVLAKATQAGLIAPEQAGRMSDREIHALIFAPGFSTAESVTNVSGRGVGMDVVKTNIEKIGGSVDVTSSPDKGTTIKIKIPLTLAIIPALVVTSGGDRFAIPQVSLLELVRLEPGQAREQIEELGGAKIHRLRGDLLPLVHLNRELQLSPPAEDADQPLNIVVVQADGQPFGIVVDAVNDTEEIVVKPLAKQLKCMSWFAGATIMGDGRVALILDVLGLAQRAALLTEHRDRLQGDEDATAVRADERQSLLIFRVGTEARMAIPLSAVERLEEFPTRAMERSGAHSVVQYRGGILPLVHVVAYAPGAVRSTEARENVSVIVHRHDGQAVGLVVDGIIDIVGEPPGSVRRVRGGVVKGSVILQERVTDLLDLEALLRVAEVVETEDAA